MALKRLQGLSPTIARRLFEVAVTPVVDYASSVWMYAPSVDRNVLNRVQRIGAQAVTGCFHTVGTAIGEAEACIRTVKERHSTRAAKMWVGLRTLPETNPLARVNTRGCKRFVSPLQKIASTYQDATMNRLEVIEPYVLAPWEPRLQATINAGEGAAPATDTRTNGIYIVTSSSSRNGVVGMGGVIKDTDWSLYNDECMTFSATLGPKTEQNPYVASLAAISEGLSRLVPLPRDRTIHILSRDQGALRAINKPNHQSGQATIKRIYKDTGTLRKVRNSIRLEWTPADRDWDLAQTLGQKAKAASREATGKDQTPRSRGVVAKTTMFNIHKQRQERRGLHTSTGQHLQRIDTDLLGPHVRRIYDSLKRRQANTLVQLRTGMARLNGYLHQIGAIETGECICGPMTETVEHFLLHCKEWGTQRKELLERAGIRTDMLSHLLGGRSPLDDKDWTPDMNAVRATIRFALATGRLDRQMTAQDEQGPITLPRLTCSPPNSSPD